MTRWRCHRPHHSPTETSTAPSHSQQRFWVNDVFSDAIPHQPEPSSPHPQCLSLSWINCCDPLRPSSVFFTTKSGRLPNTHAPQSQPSGHRAYLITHRTEKSKRLDEASCPHTHYSRRWRICSDVKFLMNKGRVSSWWGPDKLVLFLNQ